MLRELKKGISLLKARNLRSLGFNQTKSKFQTALGLTSKKQATRVSCNLFRFGVVVTAVPHPWVRQQKDIELLDYQIR